MKRSVICEKNKVQISLELEPMELTVLRHIEIVNPDKNSVCDIVDELEENNLIEDTGDRDYIQTDLGKELIEQYDRAGVA